MLLTSTSASHPADQCVAPRGRRKVRRHAAHLAAVAPRLLAHARHGRVHALLRPTVDDDGRTFLRQRDGGGEPDARGGAGDDRTFAAKVEVHRP
jgi:hypothetical protein